MLEEGALAASLRRRALEVALLLVEPGERRAGCARDRARRAGCAAGHGPTRACDRGLDDAQWLDPASAGVLQVALRRLRDQPVGLLATVREAPES